MHAASANQRRKISAVFGTSAPASVARALGSALPILHRERAVCCAWADHSLGKRIDAPEADVGLANALRLAAIEVSDPGWSRHSYTVYHEMSRKGNNDFSTA